MACVHKLCSAMGDVTDTIEEKAFSLLAAPQMQKHVRVPSDSQWLKILKLVREHTFSQSMREHVLALFDDSWRLYRWVAKRREDRLGINFWEGRVVLIPLFDGVTAAPEAWGALCWRGGTRVLVKLLSWRSGPTRFHGTTNSFCFSSNMWLWLSCLAEC